MSKFSEYRENEAKDITDRKRRKRADRFRRSVEALEKFAAAVGLRFLPVLTGRLA